MAEITAGAVHAFYLFDVAQGIDLPALRRLLGPGASPATLQDKSPRVSSVRYFTPPVVAEAAGLGLRDVGGFQVRIKAYDYGVISLMLSRPFTGDWPDLVRLGQDLIESETLERQAAEACGRIAGEVRGALIGERPTYLSEDYLAFVVHSLDRPMTADELVEARGADIAQLLRGERQRLGRQEREEVLRLRLSYLPDDLVVPAYNAAFVLDSEASSLAVLEILELVNAQLLEFRYHDELLEAELARTYASLQHPRWIHQYLGRRPAQATRRLHALFVDINELTDRMENAVKLVGDVYAARLFGMAAARLGLDAWKRNVEDKLRTLNDIYRFTVEQRGVSQGNLLEVVIVLILVLELALLLLGIMH
jgi:hypothetical protein